MDEIQTHQRSDQVLGEDWRIGLEALELKVSMCGMILDLNCLKFDKPMGFSYNFLFQTFLNIYFSLILKII